MILGPISTVNPFADPALHWCEAGFSVGDVHEVAHEAPGLGPVRLTLPEELTAAVPKRRSEFLAGRLVAALALRQAGLPEVVGRAGRAPVWPAGVAGSITHSKDRAIAAVSTRYRGVGLDCEALVAQDRATHLAAAIFTEAEARLRPDALPFGTFFTLVFSAKEALYKALSPRLGRVPEFLEVTLTSLQPGEMALVLDGESHRAQFRLSSRDCVTLVTDQGL
jgi:enterobactin synthetase component D